MNAAKVTVWGAGTPRTLRVYWALCEFEIPFDKKVIRTRTEDMDDPHFLAVSPGKKIPGFQHGDLMLTESGAIVHYLFEQFGPSGIDVAQRAEIMRWSFFALTEIDATALYVMRRHRDLPQIYGEANAAVTSSADYFTRQAVVLDKVLADGRPYVVSGMFSAADIFIATCCDWALAYELTLPDALAAYHRRLQTRSSYKAAVIANAVAT